jgi:dTMP kinase
MFVVFEGIDGSGKTTISNRVAQAMRQRGLTVAHVREGGRFASGVTQGIREFCRDARNLELGPRAEFLLYVARDVQLMEEALVPALERADLVIADRFLYTAEVLARHGRGLPEQSLRPVLESAANGIVPDLVVLVDVDPSVAKGRRKVSKIQSGETRPSSRKGLGGSGLQQRFRDGYRELAARDPGRWVVVDNTDQDLDVVVDFVLNLVATARERGVPAAVEAAQSRPLPHHLDAGQPLESAKQALAAFLDWVDRRAQREPLLAAYTLAGLHGAGIDERRLGLATKAPKVIGHGLKGLSDNVSWQLRRMLLATAPREVALSLEEEAAEADEAWKMRRELLSVAPAEVAFSLEGLDDEAAWDMREALYREVPNAVMSSLALLDGARAWEMRERWLTEHGDLWPQAPGTVPYEVARVAARSITGLEDERSWQIRKATRDSAPVAAIVSLKGTSGDKAWAWRERYVERAPKAVLTTIAGLDDVRAWALREAMAPRCREALDSMVGLDHPIAWEIREECLDLWPSSVVKSLGVLVNGARGYEILMRQLSLYPQSISLLKHSAAIASGAHLTAHVMAA